MKMPRHKSLKTIFVETVMFICVFALMGHLSVNFWERYVIQNELTKMKTSLHSLKNTINNIGVAYDHLHKELKGLAEIAERQQPIICPVKTERKAKSVAQQMLQHTDVQTAKVTHNKDVGVKPRAAEKDTQKSTHRINKDVTTHTAYTPFKGHKSIGPEPVSNDDKTIQHTGEHWHAKVLETYTSTTDQSKNASTITRYPLKSTAAGNDVSGIPVNKNTKAQSNKIHKCYKEDSNPEIHYLRF